MEIKTLNKLGNISEREFIIKILSIGINNGLSFALWRNPDSDFSEVIIGNANKFNTQELELDDSGFIFHPYTKDKNGYIIKPVFQAVFDKTPIITIDEYQLAEQIENESNPDTIIQTYDNVNETAYCESKETFINYVENGISRIKNGELQKVVPSRSKKITLPENFDSIDTFQKLSKLYENAFVSYVSIPEAGTWLGATPELLINVDQNKKFKTVALAGTQQYDGKSQLSSIAWTQKEIEEQALVSRYIINCFKKIRLREFEENGPKTVIAGNLIHLKTTFEVDMVSTNYPQLGTVMIKLLHPTSAICGMPQDKAEEFIIANEKNKRSYFSGFLGPVNINNSTSLFVNLRCMQILKNEALVYAGAGLTEDSSPLKEYQETELKMNTLLNVINV